eukprot:COSAG01_NODE_11131_length_1999_cov_29.288947_1_plen_67_part_10
MDLGVLQLLQTHGMRGGGTPILTNALGRQENWFYSVLSSHYCSLVYWRKLNTYKITTKICMPGTRVV